MQQKRGSQLINATKGHNSANNVQIAKHQCAGALDNQTSVKV